MTQPTIQLHEVDIGQGISTDDLARLRSQRLNFFPDRPLGDDEFDRMQAWSDHRLAGLETSLQQPGIIDGLECRLHEQDGSQIIQLFGGRGLGRNHQLYALDHVLEQDWQSLRDEYLARPDTANTPLNGLYVVVLDADFFHMDVMPNQQPCQRDELDRLRDARIQRGLMLSLTGVNASLWNQQEVNNNPALAANRFLGLLIQNSPLFPDFNGISVALIGVRNNELRWMSHSAAAFESDEKPVHRQLREHFHNSIEKTIVEGLEAGQSPLQAMSALRFAWLPAAAELPAFLLENPAGVLPLPVLKWFPAGADEELQVISESSLPVIMQSNLERAATGFDTVADDHYRIGLVVSDDNYRSDLLQLPQLEREVVELLHRKGRESENATATTQKIWDSLAAEFDQQNYPEIATVPERPQTPLSAQQILNQLSNIEWQAKSAGATLTAPYSSSWPAAPDNLDELVVAPTNPEAGLLAQLTDEIDQQERLSEMLQDIDDMLEMLEQEKKQQRGLVDALTIDLARLAGGVPGDGSGIKIAKAAREIKFTPKFEVE